MTEALEQRCVLGLANSVAGQRVLDLGCGDGLLVTTVATQRARAVGIDVDHAALQAAIARTDVSGVGGARLVDGRIECLPFPDGTFDVVTAVTVLCLASDRSAAVREAARVLRPGGRLIIGDLGRCSAWAARRRNQRMVGVAALAVGALLDRRRSLQGHRTDGLQGGGDSRLGVLPADWHPRAPLAPLDRWLGSVTTIGAAFIAVAATKRDHRLPTRTESSGMSSGRSPEADSAL